MTKEKELTAEGADLAKDPAVKLVEEAPKIEDFTKTAEELYGEELPLEVKESGIGVGFISGVDKNSSVSVGIMGENDFRADTVQAKSQDKK